MSTLSAQTAEPLTADDVKRIDAAASAPGAVNYHRTGSGPALLLLHGVGHHWQGWEPVIERLAEDFDVIAADSPGFGASPPLPDGITPTVPAYAEFFRAWLGAIGVERPHVGGNSMGGAIGLELVRRSAAASVTAFSPAGFWDDAGLRFTQTSLRALTMTPLPLRPLVRKLAGASPRARRLLLAQMHGYPELVPAHAAVGALDAVWGSPIFDDAVDAFDHYFFAAGDELDQRRVTIAWGVKDRLLPYAGQAARARTLLPAARHVALGAGHLPCWDDPAAVIATIRGTAAAAPPA